MDLLGRLMYVTHSDSLLVCSYVTMSGEIFSTDVWDWITNQFPQLVTRLSRWQGILTDALTSVGLGYATAGDVLAYIPETLEEGTTIPVESIVLHGNDVEYHTTGREWFLSRIDMRVRPAIAIDIDLLSLSVIACDVVTVFYVPRLRPSMTRPHVPGTRRLVPVKNGRYVAEIPYSAAIDWYGQVGKAVSAWKTIDDGTYYYANMDASVVGVLAPTIVYPESFYHPDSVGHLTATAPTIEDGRLYYGIGQVTPESYDYQFTPFTSEQPLSVGGYTRAFHVNHADVSLPSYFLGYIPSETGQEAAITVRPHIDIIPVTTGGGLPVVEIVEIVEILQQGGVSTWVGSGISF